MNFQYKDNENISIFQIFFVPKARVELAHLYRWQILSLPCLAIAPPGHIIENKRISVVTFLKSHCDDIPHHQDVWTKKLHLYYTSFLPNPSRRVLWKLPPWILNIIIILMFSMN